jgi:hypothetical protein
LKAPPTNWTIQLKTQTVRQRGATRMTPEKKAFLSET